MSHFNKLFLIVMSFFIVMPNLYGDELAKNKEFHKEEFESDLREMRKIIIESECEEQCKNLKDLYLCVEECKKNEYKKSTIKKDYIISSGVKK